MRIFVDADACPVKDEVYRVAARYGLKVFVVANSPIVVPRASEIERVVVGAGSDAADDWIAERAGNDFFRSRRGGDTRAEWPRPLFPRMIASAKPRAE